MTAFIQVLIDGFSLGSLYALSALAIGLVFGIMRLINFAQGDLITIGGYALIIPSSQMVAKLFIGDWPWFFMVPAIVAICVAAALLTERIAFRPVRQADPATLLITSFAVSFFIQNLILIVYGGRPKAAGIFPELAHSVTLMPGLTVPGIQLLTSVVAIVLLCALALFLKYTHAGVEMRAVAEDFGMARLLGVRSNRVVTIAFALSGALAGTVAFLLVIQTGILDYRMGVFLAVYAFFATVLGGMGSLVGAALGGYVVGGLSIGLQAYLPDELRPYRDAFLFTIVIILLLVRPRGLVAGRRSRERV
jgi:branched-chain amino acid transport system permease protein